VRSNYRQWKYPNLRNRPAHCHLESCHWERRETTRSLPIVVRRYYFVCDICCNAVTTLEATSEDRIYYAIQMSQYVPDILTSVGRFRRWDWAGEKRVKAYLKEHDERGFGVIREEEGPER
jgi:hypothetical protein